MRAGQEVRLVLARGVTRLGFPEFEGGGIDAVPQPSGPGTVVKHVTKVDSAVPAGHFGSAHPEATVRVLSDDSLGNGPEEARPPSS